MELGEQSKKEHQRLGEELETFGVDAFFGFGHWMRFTAESAKKMTRQDVYHFDQKHDLISDLKNYMKAGDIVLVKGSRGMHMEDIVEGLEQENEG